jgi:short-subunit dehydrogenase
MSELTGKRALVTGASSGIGAAIARLLAADGVELVLTARRQDALDRVAAECSALGAQKVEVITADLGQPGAAATLWAAATAAPTTAAPATAASIDILINNAGFGYFRPFTAADLSRDAELLQLNIASLVELSRRFVAARAGQTGRAYLLNVSSIAAYQSVPCFAVYASSKAFVRNFTEALHDELAGSPISATCLCPGGTRTDFHAQAGAGDYGWIANRSMQGADEVAALAVRALRKGRRTVVPGVLNKLSCWGVRLVPRRFASWMATRLLGRPRPGALPSRGGAA